MLILGKKRSSNKGERVWEREYEERKDKIETELDKGKGRWKSTVRDEKKWGLQSH